MLEVTPNIVLPPDALEITFVRATGPGGQNVNKLATVAHLRCDLAALPAEVRARLVAQAGHLVTAGGTLVIKAGRFRTQARNRADAVERLLELIRRAAVPPVPRTATRPSHGAKQRRRDAKQQRSVVKQTRGPVRRDD